MAIKLLVVDDSSFFQKRITEILKPVSEIQIVGFANNGREAIEKTQRLRPDVITMDYEMPVMDGLTALRNIMNIKPTPVLMFSSLTYSGARITLDALDAGAVDFLPKNFEDLQKGGDKIRAVLSKKIKTVARQFNRSASVSSYQTPEKKIEKITARPISEKSEAVNKEPVRSLTKTEALKKYAPKQEVSKQESAADNIVPPKANDTRLKAIDIVLIGTSTGGPVALQKVLINIPVNFPKPIILIQHMPGSFTAAFAERLDKLCQIKVKLAEDGDLLKAGVALLAPGGKQLIVERAKVRIINGDDRVSYRPCVDITFASASKYFPGKALGIILTGMGSDGRDGAKLMKASGSAIWAQDEQSCVIYGMPMSIVKANLANAVLPLMEIGPRLVKEVR